MDNQKIETLLEYCRSGDPVLQSETIMDLCREKVHAAVPTLLNLLASPDPAVRANAAYALGHLGSQDIQTVAAALVHLLADPDALVRSDAVDALGLLRYTAAIDPLIGMLHDDEDPVVRASVAEILGDFGEARALAALLQALNDPDESVRAFAACSIGLLGTPELLPKLQAQLKSEDNLKVRAELLTAGYRLGEKEHLQQLLDLLNNADESLATAILNMLEDLASRTVPWAILSDSTRINAALLAVGQRLPILRSHTQQIIERLRKLRPESN